MTKFSVQAEILATLYSDFQDEEDWEDFISYNDLGLPLAFLFNRGLCEPTEEGISQIKETWKLFLSELQIEDQGFEDIYDVIRFAESQFE
jgi:hypothetical protein